MNRKLMALNVVPGVAVIGFVAGRPSPPPPTDLRAGVAGDAGFTCDAQTGKCEAVDPRANVTCDEGSVRNADTGTCEAVDPCTGVECADGDVCDNGPESVCSTGR